MFPLPVGDLLQTLQSDRERRFTNFLRAVFTADMAELLQSKGPCHLKGFNRVVLKICECSCVLIYLPFSCRHQDLHCLCAHRRCLLEALVRRTDKPRDEQGFGREACHEALGPGIAVLRWNAILPDQGLDGQWIAPDFAEDEWKG